MSGKDFPKESHKLVSKPTKIDETKNSNIINTLLALVSFKFSSQVNC